MFKVLFWKFEGRSKEWPLVRSIHLSNNPKCFACGSSTKLEVHHIIPFGVDPAQELDNGNLLTLCAHCHLVFGHLRDWRLYNKGVIADCRTFRDRQFYAQAFWRIK